MNPGTMIEIGVGIVLLSCFMLLIYFWFERSSAFKFALAQINKFSNKTELEILLTQKMIVISTIASNALYIGLLGTTLGIILTLNTLDIGNKADLIKSLSLPLLATAASLVVAIFANFIYSILVNKIENILKVWDIENGFDIKKEQ